jgi:hypothetical protein
MDSSPTYTVTLREALKLPNRQTLGIFYAFAYVWSPQARDAPTARLVADGMKAWWNGQLVLSDHRHQKWSLMRDCWAERGPFGSNGLEQGSAEDRAQSPRCPRRFCSGW